MGQINPQTPKSELTSQQLQLRYSQSNSAEYFPFYRSNGFRNTSIMDRSPSSLTNLTPFFRQSKQKSIKKQDLKLIKKRVTDPCIYPYSCIGLLMVNFNDNWVFGTGSLIGKNLVLTAASNIYNKQTNIHPTKIKFVLNVNGKTGDVYNIRPVPHFPEDYRQQAQGSHRYNFAILEIQSKQLPTTNNNSSQLSHNTNNYDTHPGLLYGYLGIYTRFTGKQNIFIYGYSSEVNEKQQFQFLLRGEKTDKLLCRNGSINYTMESSLSETGSPILIRRNEHYQLVGIHISSKKELSSGLQFDQYIRSNINSWVRQPEGFINLSSCSLTHLDMDLLTTDNWHNMAIMNLNSNALGDEGLKKLTKRCWPMLRDLSINQNNINKLDLDPSAIKNTQKLSLSQNYIKDITPLAELPLLRVLDLSGNRLQVFDDLLCLKYMERLDLSSNRINKIPTEIVRLADLKKLYLSKNELEQIPSQLIKLKDLIVLALDKNRNKFIPNETVLKLEHQNVQVILQ